MVNAAKALNRHPILEPRELGRTAHRDAQVVHQARGERIDPAVDADLLATRPGVLDEDVRGDIAHLADDVQLAEPVQPCALVGDRLKLMAMVVADLADRVQPVVHQAAALTVHRRGGRARLQP